jgi:hypothetical protein
MLRNKVVPIQQRTLDELGTPQDTLLLDVVEPAAEVQQLAQKQAIENDCIGRAHYCSWSRTEASWTINDATWGRA